MERARFNEEALISILKEVEAGANVAEVCRHHEISHPTFYTWRNRVRWSGGLEISELRRLRHLQTRTGGRNRS